MQWRGRLCMHPGDPSLRPARKLHKRRWLDVDINKITGPLTLDMVEPGSLVIVDDALELPRNDPRKAVLYDLLNAIATRGRHHRGTKGNTVRGCEYHVISHYGSDRKLVTLRNASKAWVLFPSCSRTQSIHILRSRLHRTKKEVEALLDRCGDSRYAYIRHHHPGMIISANHIELLN